MALSDPGVPPEAGTAGSRLRAKNLKNTPLILRPREVKSAEGRDREGNPKMYDYMECDVWVLDRQGVVESDTGIRVTWWRALEQLKNARMGSLIACRPVEQDDNSVVLAALEGAARDVAEIVAAEIEAGGDPGPMPDDGTEIF